MLARIWEIPDPNETNENIIDHGAVIPRLVPVPQIWSQTPVTRSEQTPIDNEILAVSSEEAHGYKAYP